ncbi:hypothetical protein Tco_1491694 [Tanacetum coccineum]
MFKNNVPTTKRVLVKNLQNFSSFLYAHLSEDNWVKHEESIASYADLRVAVEGFTIEGLSSSTPSGSAAIPTITPPEANATVWGGENSEKQVIVWQKPPSYTEGEPQPMVTRELKPKVAKDVEVCCEPSCTACCPEMFVPLSDLARELIPCRVITCHVYLSHIDSETISQTDEARSFRVPIPLPDDPYMAFRQVYLATITGSNSEPFEDSRETEIPQSLPIIP